MPSDNAWHPAPPPVKAIALSFVQVDFNPFEIYAPLNHIVRLETDRTDAGRNIPAGRSHGSNVRLRAG